MSSKDDDGVDDPPADVTRVLLKAAFLGTLRYLYELCFSFMCMRYSLRNIILIYG